MKREEEIAKYCEDMGFPLGSCSSINSIKALTASDAIKWADETMLDKVCKWLDNSLYDTHDNYGYIVAASSYGFDKKEFIEAFRSAIGL